MDSSDKTGGPTTKGPSLRPSARRSEELSTRRIYVNDMNGEGNTTLSCLQGGLVIAPWPRYVWYVAVHICSLCSNQNTTPTSSVWMIDHLQSVGRWEYNWLIGDCGVAIMQEKVQINQRCRGSWFWRLLFSVKPDQDGEEGNAITSFISVWMAH